RTPRRTPRLDTKGRNGRGKPRGLRSLTPSPELGYPFFSPPLPPPKGRSSGQAARLSSHRGPSSEIRLIWRLRLRCPNGARGITAKGTGGQLRRARIGRR